MAKVISVVNQKGGVGKTTSAVNLSAAVGAKGKRVLLVDIVPQGNTTSGYGISRKNLNATSYDILINSAPASSAVIKTRFAGVDILPSNMNLAGADIELDALNASDTFLVPIQCEYYALEGLSQLMATVRTVKRLYNPYIELEGVLLTMYDGRLNLTQQVVTEVKNFFPKKVYSTVIPRNVRLSEAPSFGEPVMYYDRSSKGAESYERLADEFLGAQR